MTLPASPGKIGDRQPKYQERCAEQGGEIDPGADGDEEQPQKHAFEGFEVAFHLVPEFTACKDHTGQKRPQRRADADFLHQQRDADDEQQGRSACRQPPAHASPARRHGE